MKHLRKNIIGIFILMALVLINARCTQESDPELANEEATEIKNLKSTFDNNFDWENSYQMNMKNNYGQIVTKNVPWNWDSNAGVPNSWKDKYIQGEYSKKMYTKEKGWELVYSNIAEATSYKYIGLYNKYTGILRFFMCVFADPGGAGTTQAIWGISVDKATSLFNFTKDFAQAMDAIDSKPAFISTTEGAFNNTEFSSVGLQNGVWYGLEIECAYDPTIKDSNNHLFTLMGRAVDKIKITGEMESLGQIQGTITGTSPSSSINLNFSNMLNNSGTDRSIKVSNENVANALGTKIDDGIKKNDSFFKSLWSNIKNTASKSITSGLESGAKKGMEAIISQGGSVVADALGGLVSSLIGGKKETVSTADLQLKVNSTISLEGEKTMAGWTNQIFPVSGSSTNPTFKPLYNGQLGVWNLKTTPTVEKCYSAVGYYTNKNSPSSFLKAEYFTYYLLVKRNDIELNPEIKDIMKVENFKEELISSIKGELAWDATSETPYAYINDNKYFYIGFRTNNSRTYTTYDYIGDQVNGNIVKNIDYLLVRVSFELVNTKTNERTYISKYFRPNLISKYAERKISTGPNPNFPLA